MDPGEPAYCTWPTPGAPKRGLHATAAAVSATTSSAIAACQSGTRPTAHARHAAPPYAPASPPTAPASGGHDRVRLRRVRRAWSRRSRRTSPGPGRRRAPAGSVRWGACRRRSRRPPPAPHAARTRGGRSPVSVGPAGPREARAPAAQPSSRERTSSAALGVVGCGPRRERELSSGHRHLPRWARQPEAQQRVPSSGTAPSSRNASTASAMQSFEQPYAVCPSPS